MTWQITGKSMEFCSCKMFCPCWLGPEGEPDQGWCAGVFGFDVRRGESDGVDLSGTRVVFHCEWPGNFFEGNGTARLYIDEAASEEQRRELEAIFSGKNGGPLEPLFGAVVTEWLPARVAKIDLEVGESPSLTVDGVGKATLARLKDGAGQATRVSGAAAQAPFQLASMDLASAKGSRWSDPDMRSWEGDSGTVHEFSWAG